VWGLSTCVLWLRASSEANAEESILAQPGGPYTATPGGEIARIQTQRPLPNAFGFGDIFGRKVETDGKAMIGASTLMCCRLRRQ
jgi:hypothetical protein